MYYMYISVYYVYKCIRWEKSHFGFRGESKHNVGKIFVSATITNKVNRKFAENNRLDRLKNDDIRRIFMADGNDSISFHEDDEGELAMAGVRRTREVNSCRHCVTLFF